MKPKFITTLILLLITTTLFAGCNKQPPAPQAVVLNMGKVGEQTDITERMKEQTDTVNQRITEEMEALTASLGKKFEDEKARLVDMPAEEAEKQLQTLKNNQKKQVMQARNELNARRTKEISAIRQSFVDDIMSVAQEVASGLGTGIILKATAVHWSEGSVDITNEVIARMNAGKYTQPASSE